jgi:hypothetical protein
MKYFKTRLSLVLFTSTILMAGNLHSQLPSFPGAEGYGADASGGRGGHVVAVTNLLDDPENPPEGSLRWAFKQGNDTIPHPVTGEPIPWPGKLTVVFRVSGIIELQSELTVQRSDLTIAGQTAPGDGICIKNYVMTLRGDNIILRYMRFRPGLDAGAAALSHGVAGLDVENCTHVIVDHCSFSWANEEDAIFYDNRYTTVQWCIASEGLYNAGHAKGSRSYCGVWGGQYSSIHHNLIAHNRSRTIRFNGARAHDTYALVDYRNNVNYNWGSAGACYGGEVEIPGGYSRANMVNNYYKPGPATPSTLLFIEPSYVSEGNTAFGVGQWYLTGNFMYSDAAKSENNWQGVNLGSIPSASRDAAVSFNPFRVEAPLPTQTAEEAYQSVLGLAGANFPKRDTVDARIVHETLSGTATGKGSFGGSAALGIIDDPDTVGGYPEYLTYDVPEDADADGIDDAWETEHGLDPGDPSDRNNLDESGYTMLEMYINGLVKDYTLVLNPVVFVKGVADAYCLGGDPVSLTGAPRGGYFEEGPELAVYGDSVVFTPEQLGDYQLKYHYSDGQGYTDSVTEILTVHPLPEASVVGLDTAYHVGDSYVQLTGDPAGGVFLPGTNVIVNSEGAVFKPNDPGEYEIYYRYTDGNGCTVFASATTTVYPATGVNASVNAAGVKIFPNPAGDVIRLVSDPEVSRVTLYNVAGVLVMESKLSPDGTIPVGQLPGGIYYLHIDTGNGPVILRFVKM